MDHLLYKLKCTPSKQLCLLLEENRLYILIDSLSAMQDSVSDSVSLITIVLFKINHLAAQRKLATFIWIPSYVGLQGNEINKAVKDSLCQGHIKIIKPSLSWIKKSARDTAHEISRIQHQVWVHAGSTSAKWYRIVTNDCQITISKSVSRRKADIIHRLRLGCRCNWEIRYRVPKAICVFCAYVLA